MRGPKPPTLVLTNDEVQALEQLLRRHSTSQQVALRARMVLAAANGANNSQIARREGVNVDTVRLWRRRWLGLQAVPWEELSVAERLADAPRPGKPRQITAEQMCQIVALACGPPTAAGRPITQWTHREIAEEIITRGILPHISPRHAGRLLKIGRAQTPSEPLLVDAHTR